MKKGGNSVCNLPPATSWNLFILVAKDGTIFQPRTSQVQYQPKYIQIGINKKARNCPSPLIETFLKKERYLCNVSLLFLYSKKIISFFEIKLV